MEETSIQRSPSLVMLYTNCSFGTWVPGLYITVGWPLRGVPLYLYSAVEVHVQQTQPLHVEKTPRAFLDNLGPK